MIKSATWKQTPLCTIRGTKIRQKMLYENHYVDDFIFHMSFFTSEFHKEIS
jgi:hypothetical protein